MARITKAERRLIDYLERGIEMARQQTRKSVTCLDCKVECSTDSLCACCIAIRDSRED